MSLRGGNGFAACGSVARMQTQIFPSRPSLLAKPPPTSHRSAPTRHFGAAPIFGNRPLAASRPMLLSPSRIGELPRAIATCSCSPRASRRLARARARHPAADRRAVGERAEWRTIPSRARRRPARQMVAAMRRLILPGRGGGTCSSRRSTTPPQPHPMGSAADRQSRRWRAHIFHRLEAQSRLAPIRNSPICSPSCVPIRRQRRSQDYYGGVAVPLLLRADEVARHYLSTTTCSAPDLPTPTEWRSKRSCRGRSHRELLWAENCGGARPKVALPAPGGGHVTPISFMARALRAMAESALS